MAKTRKKDVFQEGPGRAIEKPKEGEKEIRGRKSSIQRKRILPKWPCEE